MWEGSEGVIIDTALDLDLLLPFIEENNLTIKYAFVMHSHFDHRVQLEKYQAENILLVGSEHLPFAIDKKIRDGDEISIGDSVIKVIHAPGHTSDCILLSVNNMLFTTDVLFIDGCGRCDFGGNVEQMYDTLQRIKQLPDDTVIYPGHDYGNVPFDTLENQKQTNRFLVGGKEGFMRERN